MRQTRIIKRLSFLCLSCLLINSVQALEVNISRNISHIKTAHDGKIVSIQRIQNKDNLLTGGYTKTSRQCPPFCVQPMQIAPGVTTVGEIELLNFIKNKLNQGLGVLIDARTPSWYAKGTIPGSINIPFTNFKKEASDLVKFSALAKLGVMARTTPKEESFFDYLKNTITGETVSESDKWDFTKAKFVLLWCNGMWCGQSPRAIKGLLAMGFPAEKIYYYRGGMQAWKSLGLTTK